MHISQRDKPIIGITMGDPSGVGAEIIVKSLANLRTGCNAVFIVFGNLSIIQKAVKVSKLSIPLVSVNPKNFQIGDLKQNSINVLNLSRGKVTISKKADKSAGKQSLLYIDYAVKWALDRRIHGIVTAPINKKAVNLAGFDKGGHTEYMAIASGVKDVLMLFSGKWLKVGLVTRHIPIKRVAASINKTNIYKTVSLTHGALQNYFGIKRPKIFVSGLNPHAGEEGKIGDEEIRIIAPAVKYCRDKGLDVYGPVAADSLFRNYRNFKADAAICMYHDQGLTAFKTIAANKGVNISIGLPFVRTSPDHGTAFDLAWKNKADPASMTEAIKMCIRMVKTDQRPKTKDQCEASP